ncbi:murein hydrolase activator EnvC [Alkalibaculum bacchi]|uniref:murein hydrolase activator EnvC family protein n=1 Tax=Alkalibaculum bacchi TaxID=645887 RepID=UPI0026F27EA6|nr:M23 family metallopeptidase [Alkalibaculum bacchi]
MKKKVLSLLLAGLMLFSLPVYASTSDLKGNLEKNEESQDEVKEKLDANNASMEELKAEIDKLDSQIKKAENEIADIESNINKTQKELEAIVVELEKAIAEKEEQKETLDERLRVMYMYSDTSPLEILFSAQSFSDLISKVDMIKTIAEYDQDLFAKLEAIESEIAKKKEEIEVKKNNLLGMKKKAEDQRGSLNTIKAERNNYMSELQANANKLESELRELEAESNSIEAEIKAILAQRAAEEAARRAAQQAQNNTGGESAQPSSQPTTNGAYRWPVPGNSSISSSYGSRIHPVLGTRSFHTGIDIPTGRRTGVNAVAVGDGVVIKSVHSGSYGNYVIVDMGTDKNGNNISALYAHLAQRYVGAGARVSAGQAIGEVGTTGRSTGIHLHFEIRVNGSHTNPLNYVR